MMSLSKIHNWIGYLVWGFLAYGLAKAVVDAAAWLGMRIPGIAESVLYGVMVIVAAWLLLHLCDTSEKSS